GDLAAPPVRLLAVPHQETEGGLPRQERVVLAEVAQPETRVAEHLPAVEFLLAQQDAEECALAGPVAADEPDLGVVADGGVGAIEEDLVAVALVGVGDLEQTGHREQLPPGKGSAGTTRSSGRERKVYCTG